MFAHLHALIHSVPPITITFSNVIRSLAHMCHMSWAQYLQPQNISQIIMGSIVNMRSLVQAGSMLLSH